MGHRRVGDSKSWPSLGGAGGWRGSSGALRTGAGWAVPDDGLIVHLYDAVGVAAAIAVGQTDEGWSWWAGPPRQPLPLPATLGDPGKRTVPVRAEGPHLGWRAKAPQARTRAHPHLGEAVRERQDPHPEGSLPTPPPPCNIPRHLPVPQPSTRPSEPLPLLTLLPGLCPGPRDSKGSWGVLPPPPLSPPSPGSEASWLHHMPEMPEDGDHFCVPRTQDRARHKTGAF